MDIFSPIRRRRREALETSETLTALIMQLHRTRRIRVEAVNRQLAEDSAILDRIEQRIMAVAHDNQDNTTYAWGYVAGTLPENMHRYQQKRTA